MNIKFIEYDGIKGYSRVMYNDVKDSDKYRIDVAYNGKDIKDLLEYLFSLEDKIQKTIEYIETYIDFEDSSKLDTKKELKELLDILKGNYDKE